MRIMPAAKGTDFTNEAFREPRIKTVPGQTTITFHNILYEVKVSKNDIPLCGGKESKTILKGVSGILPPGLNAIMGPTGAGKTSLLDILAKRKDPKGLKDGKVLYNGEEPPSNLQLMSGYVVQDDIVMGTLTVRENITFSANLRLSSKNFTSEEREKKVSEVIEHLGLQECAETKIGTQFLRGVSGGERKRVNIGMELILDPPIIFLDEPTTGLDANTANSLILMLHGLAREGRNIIMSIHQPRYSIFSLFDKLILLRSGKVLYRGQASDAVEHFNSLGYPCPQHHNPADFFLDVLGGDGATTRILSRMRSEEGSANSAFRLEEGVNGTQYGTVQIDEINDKESEAEKLRTQYERSAEALVESAEMKKIMQKHKAGTTDADRKEKTLVINYPTGYFHQFGVVSGRTLKNLIRNPMTSFGHLFTNIFFAILIGLIYYQLDYTMSGFQNRLGCFFFLIMVQVMANLSALELFIHQRKFFVHESANGYYRVSVYFFAQVFGDLIPHRVIPQIAFSCVIYYMLGFQEDAGKFFFFALTLICSSISAASLAFLVGSSVEIFALADILVAIPYLLMMMFGGFLVNTGSLLDWLEWIKWISIYRYGINALTVNEMTGLVFIGNSSYPGFNSSSANPCLDTTGVIPVRIPDCTTGEQYMTQQEIPHGTPWDLWQNIVALVSISLGFLTLTYIQLRRIEKYK